MENEEFWNECVRFLEQHGIVRFSNNEKRKSTFLYSPIFVGLTGFSYILKRTQKEVSVGIQQNASLDHANFIPFVINGLTSQWTAIEADFGQGLGRGSKQEKPSGFRMLCTEKRRNVFDVNLWLAEHFANFEAATLERMIQLREDYQQTLTGPS